MSKYLLFLSVLFNPVAAKEQALNNVSQLEWENRVIIVHTLNSSADVLLKLEAAQPEIDDRHIVWFVLNGELLDTNYAGDISSYFIRNTLNTYFDSDFGTLLIGKDGGVKHSEADLDLDIIFRKIDSMPMRRLEMQSKTI